MAESLKTRIVKARFALGRLVATPAALRALRDSGESPRDFVSRHLFGDWGEVGPDDAAANERAIEKDSRILSAYRTSKGTRVWVMTEADRSSTCVLLPDEY